MSAGVADIVADVVVVGAGPGGIAAATRAAESGRRTVVLDEGAELGGNIWRHRAGDGVPTQARKWMARFARSGAMVLNGASVVDARVTSGGDGFLVTAERASLACRVHGRALVLATGSRERFIPFPGWTLPGVHGVGGAQALLKAGLSFAGKRVVIAGTGPLLLPVAATLARAGARVVLVAEQAPARAVVGFALGLLTRPESLFQGARYRAGFLGTPYRTGLWVSEARGTERLEAVTVTDGRTTREIVCDVLCAAYGLIPSVELPRLLQCHVSDGAVVVDDLQQTSRPGVYCAGEATGIGGAELAIVEGELAGLAAAGSATDVELLRHRLRPLRRMAARMEHAFAPRAELRDIVTPDTIVCRCEDVRLRSIESGWNARQAKLYTRAGMGPCQGRVCGASLEFLFGWHADTVRLPSEPALLSTILAGTADESADSLHQGA